MMEKIKKIKTMCGNSSDLVIRTMKVLDEDVVIIFSEVLVGSQFLNDFILKKLSNITKINNTLFDTIFFTIPGGNVKKINSIENAVQKIYEGNAIIFTKDDSFISVEAIFPLDRGISSVENEVAILGPKDSFTENLNKNIGLIRKRIRTPNLVVESLSIGEESNTRISICYMKDICEESLLQEVYKKLNEVSIDIIMDATYLKERITHNDSLFPTVHMSERPDMASFALLEGKVVLVIDNSPYVLVIPTFFTDLFHTPDDYYQKNINASFTRILRLFAFFLSIFLPAYYISITTHNQNSVSLNILLNLIVQRQLVPFPAFFEALIMILAFEILRESDIRIPSKTGTSVSILGGLILGDAAVSAGIISPMMILVIAISAIGALVFTSTTVINAIRYYRFFTLFLSAFFGLYGLFVGFVFLIIRLSRLTSFGYFYLSPIAPVINPEIRDSFIKIKGKHTEKRNPLLARKNIYRGKYNEK